MKKVIVSMGLVFVLTGAAQAAVVYSDDFESYADTAALKAAGAWGDLGSGAGTASLLPAPNGYPGQGIFTSGGTDSIHQFPETPLITDANPLVVEYDYWDYSTGTADRVSMGLRHSGGSGVGAFFELGEYNAADPDVVGATDTLTQGYAIRTVFAGGPTNTPANQSWYIITTNKVLNGWHHFKMEIGETYVTASVNVDTDVSGTPDTLYSITIPLTTHVGKKYDHIRWGGPSNLSSTGSAGADNLNIEVIPEPATLALLGLGGLLLRRRRAA